MGKLLISTYNIYHGEILLLASCYSCSYSCTLLLLNSNKGSRGLVNRVLDLKPKVTQGCGILAPAGSPRLLPGHCTVGCPLLQVVCAFGWVKCREHISLLIILCLIEYVTNKAHLSLICIVVLYVTFLLKTDC